MSQSDLGWLRSKLSLCFVRLPVAGAQGISTTRGNKVKNEQAVRLCELHLQRALRCASKRGGVKRIITERRLKRRSGAEGPSHESYGYEEYIVVQNGIEIAARFGLGSYLTIAGNTVVCGDDDVTKSFELITGIHPTAFDRYYYRVHPYREDPMPIGDYI